MRSHGRRVRSGAIGLALACVIVSCSSGSTAPSTTPLSGVVPTAVASTTPAPAGPVSVSITLSTAPITPPPTGSPTATAQLPLRVDGIGTSALGADAATVVAGLDLLLGPHTQDRTTTYPQDNGNGTHLSDDGAEQYAQPVGRTVCWIEGLCAQFGGAAATSLTFTGWHVDGGSPPVLATAKGVAVGKRWSEVAGAVSGPNGTCFTQAKFTTDGIRVGMGSNTVPFPATGTAGTMPEPKDVVVLWLEAGDLVVDLSGSC
jgi:hypothetical protein